MEKGDCFIWIQTSVYKKKVFVDDIIYCKVVDRKVDIHLYFGGKLEGTYHSHSDLENLLPKCKFCRCSLQYIINVDQVDQYSEKIPEVILVNGEHVQVAKGSKFFITLR